MDRKQIDIFICGRRSDRPRCSVPGCAAHATTSCTYALRGRAVGRTCARPLCARHARAQKSGETYCLVHDEIEKGARL